MTPTDSNIHREQFALKISQDTTLEDFQDQIRTIPGQEQFTIAVEEFAKIKARMQVQARIEQAINDIVAPFQTQLRDLPPRQQADKAKELRYLAQFIVASRSPSKIIDIREAPDFIIQLDGKRIGVELTQLIDATVIAEANAFQKMLDAAQYNLYEKYPTIKQLLK
jgi:hypothetical protein